MTYQHVFYCVLGYLITFTIIFLLIRNGKGKTIKYKRFMWGFTFIFPLSIVLSITIGLQVAIIEQQNLAVFIIIIYVFPIIIVIGLIYLFSGLVIVLSEREKKIL